GIDGTRAGPSHAAALARAAGGTLVRVAAAGTSTPVAVVRVANGAAAQAAFQLRRETTVAWAEPDARVHSAADPNDPRYQRTQTCPSVRRVDQADLKVMHAPEAWTPTKDDPKLVAAVHDTRSDTHHGH